jgi:hypothetical protein
MSKSEKPTILDYVAGIMLTYGLVYIWRLTMRYLNWIPSLILADISYIIFLIVAILSSYLVCRKTSSKHLIVGLKFSIASWAVTLLLLLTNEVPNLYGLAFSLLAIFLIGGVLGAYLVLKSSLAASVEMTEGVSYGE